jgi:dihydroorotate dehydrogenase electron transfer subunit
MPFNRICPVVAVRASVPPYAEITVEAPEIARQCRPGQFAMLRPEPPADALLGRPMSVHSLEGPRGAPDRLRFWIQISGRGTAGLARLRAGDRVRVIAPLGRPFEDAEGRIRAGERPWLVGGGIGVTPMHFWAADLCARGVRPRFLYAARSAAHLVARADLERLPLELTLATDDGGAGERGLASEVLARRLDAGERGPIFACGPEAMMKAVARAARERGLACHASLENRMACGFGVCIGCVVWRRRAGDPAPRPVRVCVEGTLFDCAELGW